MIQGETKLNGVKTYYEKHGCPIEEHKPVLVMVHGYLSSTFSFRTLIPYLKDDFTIYALDLPGFGKSEKSTKFIYSLDNYAKLVLAFLDEMNLNNVVMVGHSMGGQICLYAAKDEPGKIAKIVGLSAAGYMGKLRLWIRWASYLPFMSFYLKHYFEKKNVMEIFLEVVHNRAIVNKEMINGYLAPLRKIDFYRSLLRLARHREGDLLPEALQKIQQPILLLWGTDDKIVPLDTGKKFERDLPHAILKTFENTGHLLPEEKPKEVAQYIKEFLKSSE